MNGQNSTKANPSRRRAIGLMLLLLGLTPFSIMGSREQRYVVAYCAQDQTYAEPIFHQFEHETGITVRAIYDNEAVKTVGLANRLVAERRHPVCDIFWGNEEMRTRQLALQGVFRETNGWAAFGYRSKRLVVNTGRPAEPSRLSLEALADEKWRGKVALAYPQFGTTAAYFHVLRQVWGETHWATWCQKLAQNQPLLLDGNSEVVKAVARGDAWVGLTDSDDIADGQREGLPVAALPISSETLLIPNTVAVIRGCPNPDAAQRLFSYLQTRKVMDALIQAKALEGAGTKEVSIPTLHPEWSRVLQDVSITTKELSRYFLR